MAGRQSPEHYLDKTRLSEEDHEFWFKSEASGADHIVKLDGLIAAITQSLSDRGEQSDLDKIRAHTLSGHFLYLKGAILLNRKYYLQALQEFTAAIEQLNRGCTQLQEDPAHAVIVFEKTLNKSDIQAITQQALNDRRQAFKKEDEKFSKKAYTTDECVALLDHSFIAEWVGKKPFTPNPQDLSFTDLLDRLAWHVQERLGITLNKAQQRSIALPRKKELELFYERLFTLKTQLACLKGDEKYATGNYQAAIESYENALAMKLNEMAFKFCMEIEEIERLLTEVHWPETPQENQDLVASITEIKRKITDAKKALYESHCQHRVNKRFGVNPSITTAIHLLMNPAAMQSLGEQIPKALPFLNHLTLGKPGAKTEESDEAAAAQ